MKRTTLSMALLLCVGSMLGQTAEKLMAKWKTVEGAQYEETTEETRKAIEENKEPFGMSKEDYEGILKTFKKSEQIQLTLNEKQWQELDSDIQSLRGYETLFVQNDNKELNDSASILGQLFAPQYQLAVYGKVKGNTVSDLLLRWDIWGKVVLGHTDCKLPKDKLLQAIFNGEAVSFDNESDQTDIKDALEEVKKGDVLFVIHGKEYPDFRSTEEARNYMISNGIHWNEEIWVVGKAVKDKHPDTDRKVVIEYCEKEKDAE